MLDFYTANCISAWNIKINFVELMNFAAFFRYITASRISEAFIKWCTIARSGTPNWFSLDSCIFQTHGLVVVIKGSLVGQSFRDYRDSSVFLINRSWVTTVHYMIILRRNNAMVNNYTHTINYQLIDQFTCYPT